MEYQDPPNLEFRHATNQDARSSMAGELASLQQTAPAASDQELMAADLAGFRRLFDKFVTQPGPNVVWDKIEKLPNNSVRTNSLIIHLKILIFVDS